MTASFASLVAECRLRKPGTALVLGSGLNEIADSWATRFSLPFAQIPGFPTTSVTGHKGELHLKELGSRPVLVFQGRVHRYEGHSIEVVGQPIRIAKELGVRSVILTNASGGIGEEQLPGSLMLLTGHIQAMRPRWWPEVEVRRVYSPRLCRLMREAATTTQVPLHEGIYVGVTGPSYETPAEVRALRQIGAHAVGMSTVIEAETANQLGLAVAAISCIANRAAGLSPTPLSHIDVLQRVREASEHVGRLLAHALMQI
jgi:purine-nucleoside phosphorylase